MDCGRSTHHNHLQGPASHGTSHYYTEHSPVDDDKNLKNKVIMIMTMMMTMTMAVTMTTTTTTTMTMTMKMTMMMMIIMMMIVITKAHHAQKANQRRPSHEETCQAASSGQPQRGRAPKKVYKKQ